MSKLQEFLMQGELPGPVEMEVELAPFPFPFVIRSISERENKEIRKSCQVVSFDKKTHQRRTELNTDLYNNRLILACIVDPNLKDATLQSKVGVAGAEALLDALLTPGQYTNLLLAVQSINGFDDDVNELRDEAKNSLPAAPTATPTAKRTTPTTPCTD